MSRKNGLVGVGIFGERDHGGERAEYLQQSAQEADLTGRRHAEEYENLPSGLPQAA